MENWELRLKKAGRFEDEKMYLKLNTYFDVIGKLHSVVVTERGWWMVRIWRAAPFGPPEYEFERESRLYRVKASQFRRYVVAPDPKIAKAVHMRGGKELIEVAIFDEHRGSVESLRPEDYVLIVNVHYARFNLGQGFILHSGDQYGRGIFIVPPKSKNRKFLILKWQVNAALKKVKKYETFVEFGTKMNAKQHRKTEPPMVIKESSHKKSGYFTPSLHKKTHRWNNFAHAEEKGAIAVAQPVKMIEVGEHIVVDRFRKRDAEKYHFLTHAHADHTVGLNKKWTSPIYCSEDTAKILPLIMGYEADEEVPPGVICPLSMNTPHNFDDFTVTLLDANHCIGSVMFVFEGLRVPGDGVLCTGDFRADKEFLEKMKPDKELELLIKKNFRTVYLDNTYFNVNVPFPERQSVVEALTNQVFALPNVDIYIPMHRLGREDIIEGLSAAIMEPIHVYDEKRRIANAAGRILNFGIPNPARTINVVKRNKWQLTEEQLKRDFVIFDITMIGYLAVSDAVVERHKERVVHIGYSDHSSRQEIIAFLKCLNFKTVIPHAKPTVKEDLQLMVQCSRRPTIAFKDTENVVNIESERIEEPPPEPIVQQDDVMEVDNPDVIQPEDEPMQDATEFISPAIGSTLDAILHDQNEILEQEEGTSSQHHHLILNSFNLDESETGFGLLATPSPCLPKTTLEQENDVDMKVDAVRLQLRLDSPEEHLETLHLSPVRWERHVPVFSPQYQQEPERILEEEEDVPKSSPQSKEPSNVASPAVGNHGTAKEGKDSEEDVVVMEKEVNLISEEDDVLVEEEPVDIIGSPEITNVRDASEENVESDSDYEFDSDPIIRNLDKWSIGPPKTLFEAIQRLQDPPMPTTKRSRRHL